MIVFIYMEIIFIIEYYALSHYGTITAIIFIVWISDNILNIRIQRLPHTTPKLHRVIVPLVSHHIHIGLVACHLSHSHLILSCIPMHHQMWIVVKDNSWNNIIGSQKSDKIHHCVTSHIPFMSIHWTADIQSKKNSIILNRAACFVHSLKFIVYRLCADSKISANTMKNLMKVSVSDVMILTMDACSSN